MIGTKFGIAGAVAVLVVAITPALVHADPTAQTCSGPYGRGQWMITMSTPKDTKSIELKDAGDLALVLRTADGWQPAEIPSNPLVALSQSRVAATASSHLVVYIAKSSTNADITPDLRENWSRNSQRRSGTVDSSQADYQGYPSWYQRVRGANQLDDGTVCCIDEEAHREIAVRTATNSYLITVHSFTRSPDQNSGCNPIPSQDDFDSGAAQTRNGLTFNNL
ncbi:hypothetical protein FZI91_11525 [Mycobacterium sp. CBMA271]|uniref:hypothetical protein n=1 Tax=unclassified Mycobacteroides TaxID=2618759 RepID=UPI0012DCDF5D|nr:MULTISPECIES: hypothetical protein [unclassified Mycobacteroides]MUM16173.1 hypothetical protein [Mycobacteroides sp. CBMA 326]MUM22324.1 hypothetical protein [Mycobacteroides sp. CBMA 271]